ncbi:MAG: Nitroreductase family [Verrucomicrobiota bacterium]
MCAARSPTAARQAPSGANRQPWEIVAVTQDKMKRQLVPICKNQKFIED